MGVGEEAAGEAGQTDSRAKMRRAVAAGVPISEAVTLHSRQGVGIQERAEDWLSLRAGKLGMSSQILNHVGQPGVTDVLVNGTEIWIDRGQGCEKSAERIEDQGAARRLAVQMAAAAGKRLDDASPLVDGFLGETIRLHAVLPPLAREGPVISLRVLHPGGRSLDELVGLGMMTPELADLLRQGVQARVSLLISGATGTGKTTLLGALLKEVPRSERIVCIEEVTELLAAHPHLVHLQERQANVEGRGAVSLSELVRASLRMRPDRLVLGECRGPEIKEILSAMNTGHAGGFTTIHANSVTAVATRLMALGALAGLSEEAVQRQGATAFQAVVHLTRDSSGMRRVAEVGVFTDEKELRIESAWRWTGDRYEPGAGQKRLQELVAGTHGS